MFYKAIGVTIIAAALLTACGAKPEAGHTEHNAVTKTEKNVDATNKSHEQHEDHGNSTDFKIVTDWKLSVEKPQPNQDVKLSIQISDDKGGKIEKFDVSHEKQMHLIVVNKDLSYFDHIHPDYKGAGLFEISTKFPKNGEFKLIADFIPSGGKQKTESHWIQVGDKTELAAITLDKSLTTVVDGKEITLSFNKLEAGKDIEMKFAFKDSSSKQPITNLQPYLGAVGHVVIISSDVEQYIHNHPLEEKATGPDAKFATSFPKSGVYKIWGQFQQNGKLFVVPFVINVP
ncbi:hypothetical protein [Paenibacillus sedimenti]|uniref:Secreted protein n=1 Tax=Paenibacillus sedimenti TaxID=2770274 RepID=A0A926KU36_9BACL|nr:hypothetical protein [Paenibacillus sedimenti]MBD0383161.1 hypothetical protein [Paenibacillus sedimenti]